MTAAGSSGAKALMMVVLISGAPVCWKPVLYMLDNKSSSEMEKRKIHTSRHLAQDADRGLRLVVQHHARADARVQQNHKGRPQRRDEKVHLGPLRLLLGHVRAEAPDKIQHQQRSQAQRGVNRRRRQALERVNDDQVRRRARVDALDAHELGHLAGDDVDGGARHEGADGR